MNTTFKNAFSSTNLTGPALPLLSPAAKVGILRYKPGPGLPWQNLDAGLVAERAPTPPPANDALARFRPAGTGRQPY